MGGRPRQVELRPAPQVRHGPPGQAACGCAGGGGGRPGERRWRWCAATAWACWAGPRPRPRKQPPRLPFERLSAAPRHHLLDRTHGRHQPRPHPLRLARKQLRSPHPCPGCNYDQAAYSGRCRCPTRPACCRSRRPAQATTRLPPWLGSSGWDPPGRPVRRARRRQEALQDDWLRWRPGLPPLDGRALL
jgi:hypothetical protein